MRATGELVIVQGNQARYISCVSVQFHRVSSRLIPYGYGMVGRCGDNITGRAEHKIINSTSAVNAVDNACPRGRIELYDVPKVGSDGKMADIGLCKRCRDLALKHDGLCARSM